MAVGDTLALHFFAQVTKGWELYGSDYELVPGPLPTTLDLSSSSSWRRLGELESLGAKKKYDSLWQGTYTYYQDSARFVQRLVVKALPLSLAGTLSYQTCEAVSGRCISYEEEIKATHFFLNTSSSLPTPTSSEASGAIPWSFFGLAFLAGLAALLTPCVFPLIPMTVSYFTNQKGGPKRAIIYGLFIVLIYTLIGFILSPFMGPEVANELATGWIPNLIFFGIFVVFGLSFLGMFEIILPHQWANFADSRSEKKGIAGIFFMALTLVLVTFSCTGPIIGSVLVQAVGSLGMKPVMGMLGYSLAFALPFSLFALFPSWLKALPRSGGWLNTVKVVLGFLELAFALKFLSIADQAYHWGILDREVYLSLWIAIFSLLGFYLLGKLPLPKDSPVERLPVPRLLLATFVFAFVFYLIPGLFGAPLRALAGYLPPQATQDFDLGQQQLRRPTSQQNEAHSLCEKPLYGDLLKFPHGLQGYFDYEQAMACARAQGKPLFIDFTGHGCVNCREMEARVWSDPRVLKRLHEDYVLVALYIDERTEVAEEKWYTSSFDQKMKKSIGRQNADLQIRRFQNNAQPYYVLLGADEAPLVPPRAYDLSVTAFIDFLDAGLEAYAQGKDPNTPLRLFD